MKASPSDNARAPLPLPSGTVTFLFTDIEGSTRLWEREPDAMRVALARHDTLVRNAIEAHGGMVFKTMGDAFCAAFATAPDALDGVLQAQRDLLREPWSDVAPLRVRIALHTGVAEMRDNDYFGAALSRTARLLSAAHGKQSLVSAATYELVRDHLPPGTGLRDLGACRLKDLERPEQVYQIMHPDLPGDFPSLRSLDNTPNNLPGQPTSFIGREAEMKRVRELLGRTRLLTLTGAGGSGKTRLALQVAADRLDDYADGVWLVELAPVSDGARVAQSVANALGVKEQAGQNPQDALVAHLQTRQLLLLLDNGEHVIAACAALAAAILRGCPTVRILATSREAFGIAGETTFRVPSLPHPDAAQSGTITVQSVSQYEAVRLFIERAVAVKPDFAATNTNAPALAGICSRLDGIPLALELAAARVRSLSVEEINARLDSRFRLLTGGDRAALPRQQTLRALVDWSYDLLTGDEKTLFARLSVFAGGFTLSAAETVCDGEPLNDGETMDLLTALVDKSLVVADEINGTTRYRLLETLRQYAAEKLDGAGETRPLRARHRAYFLALAEEAEPHLQGAAQVEWLTRLQTEYDNVRTALAACDMDGENGAEAGLRLSGALLWFWVVRGYLSEGREHLANALARANGTEAGAAKAKGAAGVLACYQGDYDVARTLHTESLAGHRATGDTLGIATAIGNLGQVAAYEGDYDAARARYNESLLLRREIGDRAGIAVMLNNLGLVARDQCDFEAAQAAQEEGLAIRRELGDRQGIARSLNNLGLVNRDLGNFQAARTLYEESLVIKRELGDKRGIGTTLSNLAIVLRDLRDFDGAQTLLEEALIMLRELGDRRGASATLGTLGNIFYDRGDFAGARTRYNDSLRSARNLGNKQGVAIWLGSIAEVLFAQSDHRQGVLLAGATDRLREQIGTPLPPDDQMRRTAQLQNALATLGDDAYNAAWQAGRETPWQDAARLALGE